MRASVRCCCGVNGGCDSTVRCAGFTSSSPPIRTFALDDGSTRLLGPGDLVVLPRADAHTMSSSADARGPSYSSLKLAESSAEVETIFGEGSPATRIVCGVFFFADEDHPAVSLGKELE